LKPKKRKLNFKFKPQPAWIAALAAGVILVGYLYFYAIPSMSSREVKVYFFQGGELIAVKRAVKATEAPLSKAIHALLKGPSEEEMQRGIVSLLPPGAGILGLSIKDKTAILNFNRRIEPSGGGSDRLRGLIAQIVYTVTDIPGVEKVWLWEEGKKELVLGGEGLVLDKPVGRADL
jgi:spore germination protein GerM